MEVFFSNKTLKINLATLHSLDSLAKFPFKWWGRHWFQLEFKSVSKAGIKIEGGAYLHVHATRVASQVENWQGGFQLTRTPIMQNDTNTKLSENNTVSTCILHPSFRPWTLHACPKQVPVHSSTDACVPCHAMRMRTCHKGTQQCIMFLIFPHTKHRHKT